MDLSTVVSKFRPNKTFAMSAVIVAGLLFSGNGYSAVTSAIEWQKLPGLSSQAEPNYPFELEMDKSEGWVQLSIVVNESGEVINPIVYASSGQSAFEQAAIEAAKKWRFAASSKARAFNQVQINFHYETDKDLRNLEQDEKQEEVNKRFLSRFKRALSAIEKGKMKEARKKLDELEQRSQRKWIENSYLAAAHAYYSEKLGDYVGVMNAVEQFQANENPMVPRSLEVEMLKKYFVAALQSNRLGKADTAYRLLQQKSPDNPAIEAYAPYYKQVQSFLNSDATLEVIAQTDQKGIAIHDFNKSAFSIASESELNAAEIRCENFARELGGAKEYQLSLEPEWGECVLIAAAPTGTMFTIYEQ